MSSPTNPRVFISYSHDNRAHCDAVLALAQHLRRDGIAAELDQFHQEELLHWPHWCEEQMRPENADFILCVCTAEYKSRVEGQAAADVGKGVFWEGRRVYNEIYRNKGNRRFVPVLLAAATDTDIPEVLDGYTWFKLDGLGLDDTQSAYAKLYRLLTGQPGSGGAVVGATVSLPALPVEERQTDFMVLIAVGLQRIEETQSQHTESLGDIADSQADQAETLANLWDWLKRWRVWLLSLVLLLAVLGGLAWWTLPARTSQVVAYQFNAKAVATRLRDEVEQRFQTDLAAAHQANKNWEAIRELENNRDANLNRVDDIVTFIEQGLAGTPDPIFKEATKLLELQGSDAALGYLESHRAKILANADQAAQQAEAAEEKLHDSLRPLLLEAKLRQDRQEWDAALKLLQTVADKAPQWWEARVRLGSQLEDLARYAEAEQHLRAAVALAVDEKDQATALNNLALMLQETNRLAEAEPLMRKALAIDEKSYGPEHPMVAIDLDNLAQLLQDTNRLAEAEPLMRRALEIEETTYGPDHPDVAITLSNLAQLLKATNQAAEAEPLLRRALDIGKKNFGPDHPAVALRLGNLAELLKATNRLEEAEPLMRRALAIDEKIYGPEHPDVASDLNNLALLLKATNRLDQAEPLIRRALGIDEKSFGPENPNVARDLNNLATLMYATKRLAEAEPLMRRALAIDEKSYGPEHPEVATALNNLASLLQDTKRLDQAEPLMHRALGIDEKSYGPEHPDVARDLHNLATLMYATKRLELAELLERRNVLILLKSTRAAGHELPYLRTDYATYQALLFALHLKPAAIAQRLDTLGSEAGYTAEEWAAVQAAWEQVRVVGVVPGSQAEGLGLQPGDVISRYAGEKITRNARLIELTSQIKTPAIPLTILRAGKAINLTAQPGKLGVQLE